MSKTLEHTAKMTVCAFAVSHVQFLNNRTLLILPVYKLSTNRGTQHITGTVSNEATDTGSDQSSVPVSEMARG